MIFSVVHEVWAGKCGSHGDISIIVTAYALIEKFVSFCLIHSSIKGISALANLVDTSMAPAGQAKQTASCSAGLY